MKKPDKDKPLLGRCKCGKVPAHIKGELDLWWLFRKATGWNNKWNKQIKYVALCPSLTCDYSAVVYHGQPSSDLLKHLAMWQPVMQLLAFEYYNFRYWLSEKQWKARRYPKRGVPMAPDV
jgi:hypothetical protein